MNIRNAWSMAHHGCYRADYDDEEQEGPLFENARLIGYFRIARLKFLAASVAFGAAFIIKGVMCCTGRQAAATTEVADIFICLALGILGYLCWRAHFVVEKALVRTMPDAHSKVRHAICVCHLFTFIVSLLGGMYVCQWLATHQIVAGVLGGLTAFILIFKLLMIEKSFRILQWFSGEAGRIVYPLSQRRNATPRITIILSTVYFFALLTYAFIAFRIFGM